MLKIQMLAVVVFCALIPVAEAKDVSAQQAGVEYARQEVEKADAQNKSDLKEVAEAEKLLGQRKKAYELQVKKLADDRKKAELSKKHLHDAKVKYDRAQVILDQAWKE